MAYFLAYPRDYAGDFEEYPTKKAALAAFRKTGRELARVGQYSEAVLYRANDRADIREYPDFALSFGRSGLRVEKL